MRTYLRFMTAAALILLALILLCACGTADTDTIEATDNAETADAAESDAGADTDAAAYNYTVIFDSRGGTEVAPFTAPAGSPLHLGANPTKEGSAFVTWEDQWGMPIGHGAENTDVEWDTEPGQEITLYAVWE